MQMPINIQDVYKIYDTGDTQVCALWNVNLQIKAGDFVAIVGRSGSGKSTLMNIIGCLDVPSAGKYYLNGKEVSRLSEDEIAEIRNKHIGFIFQGFNLVPSLTALENVELPLFYRKIPRKVRREVATEVLRKVGLSARLMHRPHQMSGGQQQRVAIARAIVASPELILADEPTGNLDSRAGSETLDILKELNETGRTLILITHDDKIAQKAARILQIKDGVLSET